MGVAYGDGSVYEGQDADLRVAGWGLVANTATEQPVSVSGSLPNVIQDVDGAELFALFMFLRIARAPAQYVTDTSTNAGVKPPRPARRRGRTCGATFGANRCDSLSVRRLKSAHSFSGR